MVASHIPAIEVDESWAGAKAAHKKKMAAADVRTSMGIKISRAKKESVIELVFAAS
jgi:hypothetical protein